MTRFIAALTFLLPASAHACWDEAGARYRVDPLLLFAIAKVESGLRPDAVNRDHFAFTKSYDIGLMQINSRHLPTLRQFGITERDLYNPCTNIQVGAWLLSDLISRHGLSWEAVGAYNAACSQLKGRDCQNARASYAMKVHRALTVTRTATVQPTPKKGATK